MECRISDSGVIGSEQQIYHVLDLHPVKKAIVGEEAELISHWWLLTATNGEQTMYFGTEETFKDWCDRKPKEPVK